MAVGFKYSVRSVMYIPRKTASVEYYAFQQYPARTATMNSLAA